MTVVVRKFVCPSCGWPGLNAPPYEKLTTLPVNRELPPPYCQHWGAPSYEVCPCCGFEYGFDDDPGASEPGFSFDQYLDEWVARGANWFDPSARPEGWSLDAQLAAAGISRRRSTG
jgi:hypothetical protein